MPAKRSLLKTVPLFSAFRPRELSRVASVAQRIGAEPGSVLAEEGEPGRRFFVIEDGRAAVQAGGRPIATLRPGDFFGEMALLDGAARSARVVAETPMSLYVIDAAQFHRLLDEIPFLTRQILRGLSNRLRAAEDAPTYVWNRF